MKKESKFILIFIGLCLILGYVGIKGLNNIFYLKELYRTVYLYDFRIPNTRELPFNRVEHLTPNDKYLSTTDGLNKKSFRFKIDADGYVYPSQIHKKADNTILFLGGSTTECRYVDEENRFPYLVGRILEDSLGKKVNSLNSGISGNNSLHSINLFMNKGIGEKPQIAVMMHAINDLTILMHEGSYWNDNPTRASMIPNPVLNEYHMDSIISIKSFLFKHFFPEIIFPKHLSKALFETSSTNEFDHNKGKDIKIDSSDIIKAFEKNILAFIRLCESYQITPALMTQQNRIHFPPTNFEEKYFKAHAFNYNISYKEYYQCYISLNKRIRKLALKHHVLLIDLDKKVPKDKKHIYDVCHLNDGGSKFVAEIVAAKLLPLLK